MDKQAVYSSTDAQLQELGLHEKGHIICLKLFCRPGNEINKNELAFRIKSASNERVNGAKKGKRLKSVLFGWKHYDKKKGSYVLVRASNGGGSRCCNFPPDMTLKEVLKSLTEVFFPNGKSCHGNLKFITTNIGNYRGEVVENEELSLSEYGIMNKLSKIRIYLLTKKKSLSDIYELEDSCSSDSDLQVDPFANHERDILIPTITSTPKATYESSTQSVRPTSTLLGSSEERLKLRAEIDKAFSESLRADQAKFDRSQSLIDQNEADQEQQSLIDQNEADQEQHELENLRLQREQRVVEEPDLSDSHCTINVRHPLLGNKSRIFPSYCTFTQVYDWVGSLSLRPQYYKLMDYRGGMIKPDSQIISGVYNMIESDEPILMTTSGTIGFSGFAVDNEKDFSIMEKLRITDKEKLNKEVLLFEVSRSDIYNNMLRIYKKRGTISHITNFHFKDEIAYGDGITRDCFAEFFHQMSERMDGYEAKVPSSAIDDEELELVGNIITHAFIQHSLFPLQLCKASLKNALFDTVDNDDLQSSFLMFVTNAEADLISQLSKGFYDTANLQGIMDIFHEYNVFEKPSVANINKLSVKAAKIALIRRPFLAVRSIVKGMGMFWKKVTPAMIDSLYETCVPTSERLLTQMQFTEETSQDQRISTWLHRYVRSCNKSELMRLVRFITGASTLLPDTMIKVQFVNQQNDHLRPLSQTCFKIFMLPRQVPSFSKLCNILNTHLGNSEHWSVHDNDTEHEG